MLDALYLGSHNWIPSVPISFTPFSCFSSAQGFLLILRCSVACFANCLSRRLFSIIFQVSIVFFLGTLDSSFRQHDCGRVFSRHARTGGGFPGSGRFMCVLTLLPVWYYGMELIPLSLLLLLLSACSMERGQEETSTS